MKDSSVKINLIGPMADTNLFRHKVNHKNILHYL